MHGSVRLQIVRVFAVAVVGLSSMAAYARSEAVRLPQQCHELCALLGIANLLGALRVSRALLPSVGSNQLLFHERQEAEVGRTWHFAFKVAKWDVCRSERCTGLTAEAGASRVDPRDVLFRNGIEAIMGLDCELDAS